MSAISVNSWTAAPGKMAEGQALIKDALQIMAGYGAKTTLAITVRGGVQGTLTTMTEYADAAAVRIDGLEAALLPRVPVEFDRRGAA